jgi:hypothetical protein
MSDDTEPDWQSYGEPPCFDWKEFETFCIIAMIFILGFVLGMFA